MLHITLLAETCGGIFTVLSYAVVPFTSHHTTSHAILSSHAAAALHGRVDGKA
jgi:hypothetical protein